MTSKIKSIHWPVWLATLGVLAGQAWLHLGWETPWRSVFWSEGLMQPIVTGLLQTDWETYLQEWATDRFVRVFQYSWGVFLLLVAVVVGSSRWFKYDLKWLRPLCWLSVVYMMVLALVSWYAHFRYPIHFFEYVLRFLSPLFFLWAYGQKSLTNRQWTLVKVAIAVTFLSHGLYALQVFPSPASFKQMVAAITGWEGRGATLFLAIAGWLDVLIVIGLFLPSKYQRPILLYAIFWGLATTLARPLAFVFSEDMVVGLHQWLPEVLVRFPHFLIPWWLWSHLKSSANPNLAS